MTREEAIEIIKYASAFNSANSPLTKALNMSIEALSNERPKGRWETQYRSGAKVTNGFVSSCCDMYHERKSNYCPNCGAEMER